MQSQDLTDSQWERLRKLEHFRLARNRPNQVHEGPSTGCGVWIDGAVFPGSEAALGKGKKSR